MYIHVYIDATSVAWTQTDTIRAELLWDMKTIFGLMGDVIEVANEETFYERLALLGVERTGEMSKLILQDGTVLDVGHGKFTMLDEHEQLFSICFADCALDVDVSQSGLESPSITRVFFKGHPQYSLIVPKSLAYDILSTNISAATIKEWYMFMIGLSDMKDKAYKTLDRLFANNSASVIAEPLDYIDDEKWVKEVFDLYSQADPSKDTLFSEAYDTYVKVSKRMNKPYVKTLMFNKIIRGLPGLIIKRKSEGMVIEGLAFRDDWSNNNTSGRVLIQFLDERSVQTIKREMPCLRINYKKDDKYYTEAYGILQPYNPRFKSDLKLLDHFLSVPGIKENIMAISKDYRKLLDTYSEDLRASICRSQFFFPLAPKHYNTIVNKWPNVAPANLCGGGELADFVH